MNDTRTIKELANEALMIQDACNLSGVVHSWSRSITRLHELLPSLGTYEISTHPINKLFADKCASLAQSADTMVEYGRAYEKVVKLGSGI